MREALAMAITCVLIPSAFSEPIITGAVSTSELDLAVSTGTVDDNTRGMIAGKYDIAEMSIGTYVQVRARGADFIALPVFPARRFLQPCVYVAPTSAISTPAEISGKRVLVPQYWMTSSVWHRGLLQHEYHVPATAVEWLTTNDERVAADLPAGIRARQIMNRPLPEFFTRCDELIAGGTADVLLAPRALGETSLRALFADPVATAFAFYARSGVYPLMHTVVARGALLREQPRLAVAALDLFERAKTHALAHPGSHKPELPVAGLSLAQTRERLGGDPFPYGLAANERAIDAFLQYAVDQGLASARLRPDEAFVSASP